MRFPLALLTAAAFLGGCEQSARPVAERSPAPVREAAVAEGMKSETMEKGTMSTSASMSIPATHTRTAWGKAHEQTAMFETATFGAGCFWGVESAFRKIDGVMATAVGYSGGKLDKPTYKDVCTDLTGHAEVVQVLFDPKVVSYDALLEVFWAKHDPTQVNRQGPDYGEQYRTVIFTHSPEQTKVAEASKAALGASKRYTKPIATKIETMGKFWAAEEYHQQYLEKKGLDTCGPSGH